MIFKFGGPIVGSWITLEQYRFCLFPIVLKATAIYLKFISIYGAVINPCFYETTSSLVNN